MPLEVLVRTVALVSLVGPLLLPVALVIAAIVIRPGSPLPGMAWRHRACQTRATLASPKLQSKLLIITSVSSVGIEKCHMKLEELNNE